MDSLNMAKVCKSGQLIFEEGQTVRPNSSSPRDNYIYAGSTIHIQVGSRVCM